MFSSYFHVIRRIHLEIQSNHSSGLVSWSRSSVSRGNMATICGAPWTVLVQPHNCTHDFRTFDEIAVFWWNNKKTRRHLPQLLHCCCCHGFLLFISIHLGKSSLLSAKTNLLQRSLKLRSKGSNDTGLSINLKKQGSKKSMTSSRKKPKEKPFTAATDHNSSQPSSKSQAPPSVKDVAIHPGKRGLSRHSLAKNMRTAAWRKLPVSTDTTPDTTCASAGTKRSKTQKQCAILEMKEGRFCFFGAIPNANPNIVDAASDTEDAVLSEDT
ncbi:hypothetical protein U9M48_033225 [Paspalum notatum var. saurae]|uniref:Uncharacterized protein n=1 Tax=Paspalum notatum var. saurae TaxID=547442 RepID=A0AAQ3X639_PASNO